MSVVWQLENQDGWFQVAPFGEFPNQVAGRPIVQVMDKAGMEEQVRRLHARAAAEGERFGGLLINMDHLCVGNLAVPTVAMGWIMDLEVRDDGLWARAKWTDEGERLIGGGSYRFVSGEWRFEGDAVEDLGDGRWRLLELVGCALTNQPALPGLQPLSCRSAGGAVEEPWITGQGTPANDVKNNPPENPAPTERENTMRELALLLGLAEDATEEEIREAVRAMREQLDAMKRERAEIEAEEFLAMNRAKIGDGDSAAVVKAAYLKDPEGTKTLLGAIRVPEKPAELPVTARIPANTPATAGGFTAPDGKVFASKLAYYETLTGTARKKFLKEHGDELSKEYAASVRAAKD